jgi:hypothetical protein
MQLHGGNGICSLGIWFLRQRSRKGYGAQFGQGAPRKESLEEIVVPFNQRSTGTKVCL